MSEPSAFRATHHTFEVEGALPLVLSRLQVFCDEERSIALDAAWVPGDLRCWVGAPAWGQALHRTLLGLDEPAAGRVLLAGVDVHGIDARARLLLRRQVGYVPRHGALLANLGLDANLTLLARHHHDLRGDALEPRVRDMADMLDLPSLAGRRVADASPSLLRRVALGRVLLASPRLLLIDEPALAMDAAAAAELWRTLEVVRSTLGIAMLITATNPPPADVGATSVGHLAAEGA